MALVVRVPLESAENTRKELLEQGLVDYSYETTREGDDLLIPVTQAVPGYAVEEVNLPEKDVPIRDLRIALQEDLSEGELADLKTAYDLVGDIAILEIDEELRHKETVIGETLLAIQPAVNVVVRKDSGHEGELRLQDYVWLAGEKRFDTISIESGVRLHLNIKKSYYSVRSSTERLRVASLVQPGERVLIMFSGIGPFVCVIAKHTEAEEVIGVELNADAHAFAQENIKKNHLTNAVVHQGDVRDVVPGLGMFDRIAMPLPHTAQDFLDVAVPACNPGGMIHLYHFSSEEEVNAFAQTLPQRLIELGKTGRVEHIQRCGNLAPGVHRWSIDIRVES